MKELPLVACWFRRLYAAVFLSLSVSALAQDLPYLFEFDGSGPPKKLYWHSDPGVRYDLWKSDNLSSWQRVSGYPAVAEGLAMEHAITPSPGGKAFFKMIPIDEQPPAVVTQYPPVDGFAVRRFADLSIELSDATGIDPASIQLTVGALGTFTHAAPGLSFAGNTVTFDSGGDTALGAWGETVTATLVVADTLGNTLTHTWNFRLENEALVAANVFVFGSPTAQRAGQRVSGPTSALAARFPAPTGPQRANDPPPWSIESVLADRIVIAYEAGGAPSFNVGQLVCNLTPANESHIFYRRVISTSDSPGILRLTVMTEDVKLCDMALQGAATFSGDSVVYEVGEDGGIVRALSLDGTLTFPRIGYDFSGSGFALRDDGFQATVNGVTYSQGSAPTFLEVTMSQFSWWFTPRLRTGLEITGSELTGFEAIASGDVSLSKAFTGQTTLIGASVEQTLYDLPTALEPRRVVYLGNIGIIPVFGVLKLDFEIKSKAEAAAVVDFHGIYQQDVGAAFGASYRAGSAVDWIRAFQSSAPNLDGEADLGGELSWEISLEPQLEFLVYGLAGVQASIVPSAGVVATIPVVNEPKVCFEAGVDLAMSLAGPVFEALALDDSEISLSIWSGQSCNEFGFTTHPASQVAELGDNVSFSCVVESDQKPDFQWFHNGKPIPGQTGRSLFLYALKEGHAGSYVVKATLGEATIESDPAVLTIQGPVPDGFALIPAGAFTMGRTSGDSESNAPPVTVTVSEFYIGKYEVTKLLWDEVSAWGAANGYDDLEVNGSGGKAGNHPVHSISWFEMVKWCNARSQKEGLTPVYTVNGSVMKTGSIEPTANWSADGYRLPTEAEWEKAARGGVSGKRFPWGTDTISHSQANYLDSKYLSYDLSGGDNKEDEDNMWHPTYATGSTPYTSPVGSFGANAYGLYDMAGNIAERCWDRYGVSTYVNGASDPRGSSVGWTRVLRGGGWYDTGYYCRASYRDLSYSPDDWHHHIGFRLARSSVR
jgi:formylglycine-generating enzyme required for sulfatase activity